MSDLSPGARPLRVCHLVATTLGARWMFEQLRELRDRHGYEVEAIVDGNEGPLVDWLNGAGIRFHVGDFGFKTGLRSWSLLRAVLSLVRILRAGRYDVVQTHVFVSLLAARPAAWIAGVPVRLAMIAGPFHLEAKASRVVERMTAWMDTTLIPSCEKSMTLCRDLGVPDDRLRLIYYSADEDRFRKDEVKPSGIRARFGWPEDTPVIVLIAYFYPRLGYNDWTPTSLHGAAFKGHDVFARAAALVLEEFPQARFALVGGGFAGHTAFLEEMKALVTSLGLDGRVVFTGHEAETPPLLRDCTVAVQAALCENLGGTLEALSMACPLVATRVGGMVDVVRHEVTGRLAEPRDPEDLARQISAMLRDPQGAREMGLRGRDLVRERFSLRRTVDDLDLLYQQQIRKAGPAGTARLPGVVGRGMVALPLLALVWLRVSVSPESCKRHAREVFAKGIGLRGVVTNLARSGWPKLRLYGHLTKAALERLAYRLWLGLAPGFVRRVARRLRTGSSEPLNPR
ncbi:MAG: glycosyltransferase [Vicinamibacteria bacterium]|nr:glycosyltransferase [Vicinamibacteria bacterium]MBP9946843.1 glycosyltransferase [Vicinamibacteria bacterium]